MVCLSCTYLFCQCDFDSHLSSSEAEVAVQPGQDKAKADSSGSEGDEFVRNWKIPPPLTNSAQSVVFREQEKRAFEQIAAQLCERMSS